MEVTIASTANEDPIAHDFPVLPSLQTALVCAEENVVRAADQLNTAKALVTSSENGLTKHQAAYTAAISAQPQLCLVNVNLENIEQLRETEERSKASFARCTDAWLACETSQERLLKALRDCEAAIKARDKGLDGVKMIEIAISYYTDQT